MTTTAPAPAHYTDIEVNRTIRHQENDGTTPDVFWTTVNLIREVHTGLKAGMSLWVTVLYASNMRGELGQYIGESSHAYIGQDR